MTSRLITLASAALLCSASACGGTGHPRPMREGSARVFVPIGSQVSGGGGSGSGGTQAGEPEDDAGSAPPPAAAWPQVSACEELGQCCSALVADDEAACIAVVQAHDEPFCRAGVQRFCWNAQICNTEGCSSHAGPPGL